MCVCISAIKTNQYRFLFRYRLVLSHSCPCWCGLNSIYWVIGIQRKYASLICEYTYWIYCCFVTVLRNKTLSACAQQSTTLPKTNFKWVTNFYRHVANNAQRLFAHLYRHLSGRRWTLIEIDYGNRFERMWETDEVPETQTRPYSTWWKCGFCLRCTCLLRTSLTVSALDVLRINFDLHWFGCRLYCVVETLFEKITTHTRCSSRNSNRTK